MEVIGLKMLLSRDDAAAAAADSDSDSDSIYS